MVSIYDENFRAFSLTGEEIEILQGKKMKFRNAGHAHIQHTQPLSDEKNEQNQMKDFFSSIYFALQSIIVYLNSYQSSIFFSGNCCPNPHLLIN